MANEGEFPKDNGDILFASEVNDFKGFGDGTDGVYSDSGNLTQGTVYQYTSFSLTNGNTLTTTSTSGKPIVIFVQGNCTIAGTIDLDGKGYDGGAAQTGDGENFQRSTDYGISAQVANTSAGATGGINSIQVKFNIFASNSDIIDSGQGGAGGANADAPGGSGSVGGASIIFIIGGAFDFQATGIITLDGVNGSDGSNSGGGAGGGGGGGGAGGHLWVLHRGSLTNSGTITTTAGSGGAGGTGTSSAGGGGGGGGASFANDGTNGSSNSGANGGAGGNGGAGSNSIQKVNSPKVFPTDTI